MHSFFTITSLVLVLLSFVNAANIFDAFTSSVGSLFREEEEAPYVSISKKSAYEVREYGPLKWVCAKETDIKEASAKQTDTFLKLFTYQEGANKAGLKMEMTVPVSIQYSKGPGDASPLLSACFFIGKKYQADPPAPTDGNLTISEKAPMTIFTRQFGGYADEPTEWLQEANSLIKVLAQSGEPIRRDIMFWNAFDSPVKFWNRRNEVWIVKEV